MCNYGEIDGLPVIDNPDIIGTLLREEMGFKGVVTTDGAALLRTHLVYHIGKSYEDAGVIAKRAGTDTEIPVGDAFRKLPQAVREGKLPESCIDESVRRVLTVKFKCGLFEDPYCKEDDVAKVLGGKEKETLSRKIASDSLVLLKNDGVLPLKKETRIALVGPHADSLRYPVSGYTYPAYIEMVTAGAKGESVSIGGMADEQEKRSSEKENGENIFASMVSVGKDGGNTLPQDMNTVLRNMGATTLREELSERFETVYAPGCGVIEEDTSGISAAVEAAKNADVVVMACGGNCGWFNVTGGEGKDRQHLGLPGVQQQLLDAVAAVGKPVILVLYGPQTFALPWAEEHCAAILEAFLPGQYAGSVIADALDGTVTPGGKLTMTVPRSAGQIPIYYNHRNGSGYALFGEKEEAEITAAVLTGGYVDGPDTPLYCFGHGLSYTDFQFRDLRFSAQEVPTDGELSISVTVQNVGACAGDEVVQLYTRFTDANVTRPVMSLGGFKRVTLLPGEERTITFHLKMAQLGYYDENMDFVVESGRLQVLVGSASDKIHLDGAVQITGEKVMLKGKRSYVCKVDVH